MDFCETIDGFPAVVKRELDIRRSCRHGNRPPPPSNDVALRALRDYFLSSDYDPSLYGGYLQLLRDLGATPRSDDPLVKYARCNVFYNGFGEAPPEYWKEQIRNHTSEVRLLRYGEIIQLQNGRGLSPDPSWTLRGSQKESLGEDAENSGRNSKNPGKSDCSLDDDLTEVQLKALSEAFTMKFWSYTASEHIHHGLAHGVKSGSLKDARIVNIQVSTCDIIKQCNELRDLYNSCGSPLPTPAPFRAADRNKGRKKSAKKRNQRRHQQETNQTNHATTIDGHTKSLLATLKDQMTLSGAFACTLSALIDMLCSAVNADVDVARALLGESGHGNALMCLLEMALKHAKATDTDASRLKSTADAWWKAVSYLTEIIGNIVVKLSSSFMCNGLVNSPDPLSSIDSSRAAFFFERSAVPMLLRLAASNMAAEREPSFCALGRAACAVQRTLALSLLVKDKSNWKVLESACACDIKSLPPPSEARAEKRERELAPLAAAEAISLLALLCGRGMIIDESLDAGTPVVPGPLSAKMIERGVVPIFIQAARSEIDVVSAKAMTGLSQISRMKDCRKMLLQNPNGIDLVHDMMLACDGKKVSDTMLLAVHLMWDEEWQNHLMNIEPPLETTAVRWAVFSMKCICERADQMRNTREKIEEEHIAEMAKSFKLEESDPEEKERRLLKREEYSTKIENEGNWYDLESEKCSSKPFNALLRRCLLLLSTMLHDRDAPTRLLKVGALPIAAACIDCPAEDAHSAAANIIFNFAAVHHGGPFGLPADLFTDPDHLLHAVLERVGQMADAGEMTQLAGMFMQLAASFRQSPGWDKYLDAYAARDKDSRFMVQAFVKRFPGKCTNQTPAGNNYESGNIHEGCSKLTGKLRTCSGCGKMEGKKGEFMRCSRCQIARYCGRECQRKAWKEHKRECARLSRT